LITEFGRYVHANAGWAATRVEYCKESAEGNILITHAGADFFVRECYCPGDWYHNISVMSPTGCIKKGNLVNTSVAGPLCFGGDFLAKNIALPVARTGDFLAIRDVGANTFALWSRRPFPKVIAYRGDREILDMCIAKPRESIEDIVNFWS
jgi:diaminopimelate decarboxylase